MNSILISATLDTLYMSFISTVIACFFGLLTAIVLYVSKRGSLSPNKTIYASLDFVVSIFRSFPFLILLIVLLPFTHLLIGTSIGVNATIVPLTIGTIPIVAKMIEASFLEIDKSVIESARSYGATNYQIITKVILVEAKPALVQNFTLILILVVGFSAMAGVVGGGGLGDLAIRYGYYRFQTDMMIETVVILVVIIQIIQTIGSFVYKIIKH